MIVLGIDPGQSGGMAFVDEHGHADVLGIPLAGKSIDWYRVAFAIRAHEPDIAYVEKVHSMPKQGVSSSFKFGVNAGGIHGVLAALGTPMVLVTPQAWKKRVLAGTARDKAACIDWCRRRYPSVSLLATERSRKPHDGMADALAIATYGSIMERGSRSESA